MSYLAKIREILIGLPRNPLSPEIRQHIALIAFLAWIGLGADGLSSSCYGPEEAYLALGSNTHLSLYLALATALTVFVISIAYNQVIELFPSGGGGYKVATQLIGPYAGLVSGAALIVDYVLTISISIASGIDALFSLLPIAAQDFKLITELIIVGIFIILNMRGMKESIKVLLPLFVCFVLTHFTLIIYGIFARSSEIHTLIPDTMKETTQLAGQMGWLFVVSLFLRAYSLGSGTYTGIEAVSNNVNTLAEPRVKTGKWTMFYMALSLSFTAGGIILLYLLWHPVHTASETLNAVTFRAILGSTAWSGQILIFVLALEAGLLFVAANTGFLGGPQVLANMALDSWVPNRFRHLSSRLVTQNGIILFGIAAIAILLLSSGRVSWLVVLYSMNVFLTFSMSLLGLCIYWWRNRKTAKRWVFRLGLSGFGLMITSSILVITLIEKFTYGGWVTVLITSTVIGTCLLIRKHYSFVLKQLHKVDQQFESINLPARSAPVPALNPNLPTAVLFIGKSRGTGMHSLLWVQRMFPGHFKNFVFVSVGVVDVRSFNGQEALQKMQTDVGDTLKYFVTYSHNHSLAATSYCDYGTEPVKLLTKLSEEVNKDFSNCIFFSTKLIFESDNWITRLLHNETSITMQRRLHLRGMQLVILPMKV